jgi:Fe2+ or Zn2+ uptake regulation protein
MTANTKKRTNFETGEEELVHTNFSLVFNNWWKIQDSLLDEYPTALKIFTWLIHSADKRNAVIVSYEMMASSLNLSVKTVYRAILHLKEKQYLTVLKSGSMNIYVLNDQLIWKDTANTKDKYSSFSAKVHVMASEQEIEYQTKLIGHVIKKPKKAPKNRKLSPEEAIKGFEAANPAKSPKSGLDGLKNALNHPKEVNELVEKGWKFIEETENAYEMEDSNGFLTMLEK